MIFPIVAPFRILSVMSPFPPEQCWRITFEVGGGGGGEHQENLPDKFFHNLINFINSFVQDCS